MKKRLIAIIICMGCLLISCEKKTPDNNIDRLKLGDKYPINTVKSYSEEAQIDIQSVDAIEFDNFQKWTDEQLFQVKEYRAFEVIDGNHRYRGILVDEDTYIIDLDTGMLEIWKDGKGISFFIHSGLHLGSKGTEINLYNVNKTGSSEVIVWGYDSSMDYSMGDTLIIDPDEMKIIQYDDDSSYIIDEALSIISEHPLLNDDSGDCFFLSDKAKNDRMGYRKYVEEQKDCIYHQISLYYGSEDKYIHGSEPIAWIRVYFEYDDESGNMKVSDVEHELR